jgi:hypothetical protein
MGLLLPRIIAAMKKLIGRGDSAGGLLAIATEQSKGLATKGHIARGPPPQKRSWRARVVLRCSEGPKKEIAGRIWGNQNRQDGAGALDNG